MRVCVCACVRETPRIRWERNHHLLRRGHPFAKRDSRLEVGQALVRRLIALDSTRGKWREGSKLKKVGLLLGENQGNPKGQQGECLVHANQRGKPALEGKKERVVTQNREKKQCSSQNKGDIGTGSAETSLKPRPLICGWICVSFELVPTVKSWRLRQKTQMSISQAEVRMESQSTQRCFWVPGKPKAASERCLSFLPET